MRRGLFSRAAACTAIACMLLSATPSATAQVSITATDLLNLVGTVYQMTFDESSMPTVDTGSDGTDRSWDFSGLDPMGSTADFSFLAPGNTPYFSLFSEADLAFSVAFNGMDTVHTYLYVDIDQDLFQELGSVTVVMDPDTTIVDSVMTPSSIPIPLEYQNTFYDVERDTLGSVETAGTVITDSTYSVADAWGTLITPLGTYEVLRLKEEETYTEVNYLNGAPFSTNTSVTYRYEWISPFFLTILSMTGPDGGADPAFTTAESYDMITVVATSTDPAPAGQVGAPSVDVYPNPFRSDVTVHVGAAPFGVQRVEILDLLGRRINTLETTGLAAPGSSGSFTWDGSDASGRTVASGVYFVALHTGRGVFTRSVVRVE